MIQRYTVEQLADELECTPETVVARIAIGDIPAAKFGRGWIIPAKAADEGINDLALREAAERRRLFLERQESTSAGAGTLVVTSGPSGPRKPRQAPPLPQLQ